jgi:hypothetical protein
MAHTYSAILHGDQLEWIGESPDPAIRGRPVSVKVSFVEDLSHPPLWNEERRRKLAEVLDRLAASDPFAEITDPVAWQREIRQDRPLPGRDP